MSHGGRSANRIYAVVLWDKKCSMVQMLSTASPQGPLGLLNYSVPGLAAVFHLFLNAAMLR